MGKTAKQKAKEYCEKHNFIILSEDKDKLVVLDEMMCKADVPFWVFKEKEK